MVKKHHRTYPDWLFLLVAGLLFLCALFLPLHFAFAADLTLTEETLWEAYQNGDIIRIHIIANSDSPKDQQTKLEVRDAIWEVFGQRIIASGKQNSEKAYLFLLEHAEQIKKIACQQARKYGFDGQISVEAGLLHLPQKRFGNITLPEGDYRSMVVTLGEGAGKNWWCALFPQLCLSLSQSTLKTDQTFYWSSMQIFHRWLLLPD